MKTATLESALLFVVSALLIWPLFQIEYFDNWMSIDGGFIGDARALSEQLPNPGWTSSSYCGNRFDYLYPPAMRYSTAVLSRALRVSAARAYHIYSALMYCLGTAALYSLLRVAGWCRPWAFGVALATLLVSPVLLLFPLIRHDSALHMPQKLNVLLKWGEVPHVSGLAWLLLALAAAWVALREGSRRMMGVAALLCALCVSTNFYAATALAVFFTFLVWSLWLAQGGPSVWLRALAVVVLAYGLTAFWLTPSYLALTAANLRWVAAPGDGRSRILLLLLLATFAVLSYRLARGRSADPWLVLLAGALAFFTWNGVGFYYLGLRAVGDPHRFMPELDLLLIVAAAECLRRGPRSLRVASGLLLGAALLLALPYLRNPWGVYVADHHPERRIEYRLSAWLAHHLPAARVFTAGSLGFWANVWHDTQQVGGIADQGLQNQNIPLANWQIRQGDRPSRDLYWLQALGADAIIVHGRNSQEIYHSIRAEGKFDGRLDVLFDSGGGDRVYRVPRRFPGLARVVQRERIIGLAPIPWVDENEFQLRAYAETLEQGPESVAISEWRGSRELLVKARVGQGESLTVQVSHDPAWQAFSQGRALPVFKDVMGFMRIDPPPGEHEIRLVFETPLENRIGRAISLFALALLALLLLLPARIQAWPSSPPKTF